MTELTDGECQIWWSTTDHDVTPLLRLLDEPERQRADKLRHPVARSRLILGRAICRLLVSRLTGADPAEVRLVALCRHCAGPHGRLSARAEADTLHLSISHSGDRVAVAVARNVVCGVDVEQLALRGDAPPTSALSAVEQAVLGGMPESRRLAGFIRYWTRKEAVLKATGDGLVVAPSLLTVSAPDTPARLLSWMDRPHPQTAVHLDDLAAGPGYRAALATLERRLTVQERSANSMITNFTYHQQSH